jgi:hypothetical protein
MPSEVAEIPKDLLDVVSVKALFVALEESGKTLSFAGTTDFTTLSGFSWPDYEAYLDVQVASARFLRCGIWRVFLQASTMAELKASLRRVARYASRHADVEIVVETHGGFESTREGFDYCILHSPLRFVVDLANITDTTLREAILRGTFKRRVAYFHLRNFGDYTEVKSLLRLEARALQAYPRHTFLWEPKQVEGVEAVRLFNQNKR